MILEHLETFEVGGATRQAVCLRVSYRIVLLRLKLMPSMVVWGSYCGLEPKGLTGGAEALELAERLGRIM